ncbi:hypothetical protein [Streptomyces sp. NPDC087437]|uniref:hypothetical protein n=1 Tax=Streptomyces sp. NPDC087437 TaxID=3365789 RepID=UPI0037FA5892
MGTSLAVLIDTKANTIRFASNTDYWDGAATSLTYAAATHAWVRISEAGGIVTWATSTDGLAWTNRRTLATPAWVTTATACGLLLESYRDAGATDYVEYAHLNVAPTAPSDPAAVKKAAFMSFF